MNSDFVLHQMNFPQNYEFTLNKNVQFLIKVERLEFSHFLSNILEKKQRVPEHAFKKTYKVM